MMSIAVDVWTKARDDQQYIQSKFTIRTNDSSARLDYYWPLQNYVLLDRISKHG